MLCALSGAAPEHPVVSTKSGHIFERSLVEKFVETSGRCPVTGEPLEASDLLPIKANSTVKPRPVAAASIPGMLSLFQNEWDALMLELFTQKQQLESVRQELGHALYQHDAACRIIARLVKERDDARQALTELKPMPAQAVASAPKEAVQSGLTPVIISKFETTSKALSKGRKKRSAPADQTSAEAIAAFTEQASKGLHKAGPACVDVHVGDERLVATGGADGKVTTFDSNSKVVKATMTGHSKQVSRVRLHPAKPLLLSCSHDCSMRVWDLDGKQLHSIVPHTAEVTDCTLHATGDYCVTASMDRSWALSDLNRGDTVLSVKDSPEGYTCAGFHPDGLILGTGTERVVRIWDIKSQTNVASFEGHEGPVTCLSFSENGYYLATGADDATVKLWDLRKLKNFHTISAEQGAAVKAVHFDYSGSFLAIARGKAPSVYESKTWGVVKTFDDHSADVTGVCFGKAAGMLAATSADGALKLYGN